MAITTEIIIVTLILEIEQEEVLTKKNIREVYGVNVDIKIDKKSEN